jgi:thymidylate synthase (FAD)
MEGIQELMYEYDMNLDDWKRALTDRSGDSLPELMGRLCYGSFGPRQGRIGATDYIKNILDQGHGSVLEHACFSFVICRASRGFTHQMVRHRAGFSYSQESTHFIRYKTEDLVLPRPGTEANICVTGIIGEKNREMAAYAMKKSLMDYERLWRDIREEFPEEGKFHKAVTGAARNLLPTGIESRLGFTANARALRHFCELRGAIDNTVEIRLVAVQVARIMKQECPAIFSDILTPDAADLWPYVSSRVRKV